KGQFKGEAWLNRGIERQSALAEQPRSRRQVFAGIAELPRLIQLARVLARLCENPRDFLEQVLLDAGSLVGRIANEAGAGEQAARKQPPLIRAGIRERQHQV